jgi:hypothetical protein
MDALLYLPVTGKRRDNDLGVYPNVPIADAREKAPAWSPARLPSRKQPEKAYKSATLPTEHPRIPNRNISSPVGCAMFEIPEAAFRHALAYDRRGVLQNRICR